VFTKELQPLKKPIIIVCKSNKLDVECGIKGTRVGSLQVINLWYKGCWVVDQQCILHFERKHVQGRSRKGIVFSNVLLFWMSKCIIVICCVKARRFDMIAMTILLFWLVWRLLICSLAQHERRCKHVSFHLRQQRLQRKERLLFKVLRNYESYPYSVQNRIWEFVWFKSELIMGS